MISLLCCFLLDNEPWHYITPCLLRTLNESMGKCTIGKQRALSLALVPSPNKCSVIWYSSV